MIQIVNKAVKQAVYFPKGVDEDFGEYSLVLTSELTLKKYEFDGLEDISNSNRYLKFELDFSQMDDGEYNYYIPGVGTGLLRIGDVSNSLPERYNYAPLNCCCDEIVEYYPNGNFKPRYQDKDIYIDENGNYRVEPDSGYTALNSVNIEVNVTGYTEDDLHKAYEEGVEDQKAKLIPLYVTESGTYTREDGFNPVEVNIVCPEIKYYQLTVVVSCDDMSEIQGLIGKAKVVITYDGKTIEEIFDGSPMNFEILPGVPFRVDFSEVEEYTKPSSYSATSTWDGQETVNGVYQFIKPFHLTVDVECDGTSLCDTLVNNAYVTVFYGSENTTLMFDGDPLPFTLPGGYDYTVRFSPVDGFNTPANITGTSTAGASEIVAGQYTTKPYELYVDVECDGSSLCENLIDEVEVTVTYGSESITKTYEGNVLNFTLPGDVSYTVSFGNVTNFNTPARITGTSTWAGSRLVSGQYTTKYFELNVDVTCDDSGEIQGLVGNAIVFVSYDGHDVTQVYDGTQMTFNLPGDVNYTVSFNDVEDYDTPQSYTGTSAWGSSIDLVGTYVYNPPYEKMFLTVVATSENTGSNNALYLNTSSTALTRNVQVKVNNGEWQDKTFKYANDATNTIGGLSAGDKIRFKGLNNTYYGNNQYCYFNSQDDLSVNVEGNIMSLIYGDDFKGKTAFPTGSTYNFIALFNENRTNNKIHFVNAENLILPVTTLTNSCYRAMFQRCTSLVTAPELPATISANSSYMEMFRGCTSLTTAPEINITNAPAGCCTGMFKGCTSLVNVPQVLKPTTLNDECYSNMFQGCTSITDSPVLSATTLATRCCSNMFQGCTSLVNPPALPATRVGERSYEYMFQGCTSLVNPPALPATELNSMCYVYMFNNCTKIVTAPALPAINLTSGCYYGMFQGCTSLVNTPVLDSLNIQTNAYREMFKGCTSLVTAPQLPATTIGTNGYYGMFSGCNRLVNTQATLPATSLGEYAYHQMYQGCTSLTTAPVLPATDLANFCYSQMFISCSSLVNTQQTLPATVMKQSCYQFMYQGCTRLTTAPALPATTLADSCYMEMFSSCSGLTAAPALPATKMERRCYYNMFYRCTYLTGAPTLSSTELAEECYQGMFRLCTSLKTPPALPSTILASKCYAYMFAGSGILTAPALPATALTNNCYEYMFFECRSLTESPILSATTLVSNCYCGMFGSSPSLVKITCLATDISATNSTKEWSKGVGASGTFIKAAGMSGWTTGFDGIPISWTVQDA